MTAKFWMWAVVQAIGAALLIGAVAWWIYGYLNPGKPLWSLSALHVFVPAGMVLLGVWVVVFVLWPRMVNKQVANAAAISGLTMEQALHAWEQVVAKPHVWQEGAVTSHVRRFGEPATEEELKGVRRLLPSGAMAFLEAHSSVEWAVDPAPSEDVKVSPKVSNICTISVSMVRAWPEFPAMTIVGEGSYRSVVAVDCKTGRGGLYRRPKPGRAPKLISRRIMPEMPSLVHVALLIESTLASSERLENRMESQLKTLEKK